MAWSDSFIARPSSEVVERCRAVRSEIRIERTRRWRNLIANHRMERERSWLYRLGFVGAIMDEEVYAAVAAKVSSSWCLSHSPDNYRYQCYERLEELLLPLVGQAETTVYLTVEDAKLLYDTEQGF